MQERPRAVDEGIEVIIFLWLSLVALVFGLLGFLLHAFYFTRQDLVDDSLNTLVQSMNRKLAAREKINAEAQQEIAKTREMVKSLEMQLEQRDEQMNALQNMAERQQEEIRLLQKSASEIRNSGPDVEADRMPAPPLPSAIVPPAKQRQAPTVPLWKDNLNNILSMLDKLQNETKEQ